ncbi:MAG: hypothetical protein WC666_00445 [Candidatus Paceibacterota bacterium]|jgi:primosomal protein N'
MNIITVIPISGSKIASELSYFTSSDIPIGAIVSVPLRSKTIHAIVTGVESVENLKTDIKNAPFTIRKLGKIKATVFFPASFIDACKSLSEYYATTVGAVINTLVDNSILQDSNKIPPPLPPQASFNLKDPVSAKRITSFAVQGDETDRMSSWRSLIREEFAQKKSIVFYVPTLEDCERIYNTLEKGIEGYIWKLNGSLLKKKIHSAWKKIPEIDHPIVVIATGSFSLLPRGDIETVIIEHENGRGWISQKAPYIDIRHALEVISRQNNQTVYIADNMLRTETLYRLDKGNGDIEEGSPFKWRSISTAHDTLVDMRNINYHEDYPEQENAIPESVVLASGKTTFASPDASKKSGFRVISKQLESLIRTNREESTHLFILTIRRGLSPMTVCSDCETIVTCKNCSTPIVLHTSTESGKNFFMCHLCGERRSADETCAFCGSWRLTPLGIGIDRVSEEIKKRFPDIDLFKIDADSTKNERQIHDILEKFKSKPGSILLGTELALQYLRDKLEHIAVASLDTFFSLPDFRIQEKVMHTLIRLRAQTTRTFLVQTRRPTEKVFEYGLKGNLSDFYKKTIHERKQFTYSPFFVLIKLSIEGKKEEIAQSMVEVEKLLAPSEIDIFPAFTSTVRGKSVIHGLIKVVAHAWPDPDLIAKLRALPPSVSVKINPESLL